MLRTGGCLLGEWRNLVCVTMVIILPATLYSQNPDAAMLHAATGVQLNGNAAPASSAIFPDDLVQTPKNAAAKIDAAGSTAVVAPDTLVQFEGNQLFLEHGTVQVTTSTQMTVRVGCITAIPVIAGWTQYDVTDVDGKVTIAARKNDVNVETRKSGATPEAESARSEKATVKEGEQATRPEKCGAAIRPPDYVTGKAAFLNTWEAVTAGLIVTGVIACLGLCHSDDPMSPSDPSYR
jgi:hypothetical protein